MISYTPRLQRINLTRGDENKGRKIHINDFFSLRLQTNYPAVAQSGLDGAGAEPMNTLKERLEVIWTLREV